eukprot:894642-Heterocapsa_arctica.AAC.1
MVGRWAALLKGREAIWTWVRECQYNLTDADEFGEIDEPAYPLKTISHERLSEDQGHDGKLDTYTIMGDEMSGEVVEESYSY